jgi:predicted alpha/beta-fold hydrolase
MTNSEFRPAWWLPGPHLQTIWPALFRARRLRNIEHERLELADGDFLDLAWSHKPAERKPRPLVLVLHGLEGSLHSHYAAGILHALDQAGMDGVLMHFRGCSGEPNRLPRTYHSGDTGDLQEVVRHLRARGQPVAAVVGYSLGGNVLLKWLGEQRERTGIAAAVAISVPFRLDAAARRMDQGGSRLYRRYLLRRLAASYHRKWRHRPSPLGDLDAHGLRSFWDFDDRITAPLNGFLDVHDYYRRSSSHAYLRHIRVPTRIIHARDDPFMFADTPPSPDEVSDQVELLITRRGGHVGFVGGRLPWRPEYWLDRQITAFLRTQLACR